MISDAQMLEAERRKQRRLAIITAEREAHRKRAALSSYERRSAFAREKGERLTPEFWASFGEAKAAVELAERALSKAREPLD